MKKIMVVDDDPAIVDAIKSILEMENFEVITAYNGSTLLKIQENLPNLVLLDIWMPGIDGKTLCRKLKAQESTKNIPIVIISASRNIKEEACKAKADGYIEKPFELNDLICLVKKFT